MNEVYASPEDYRTLFRTLTRLQVAAHLQLGPRVLDIAAGSTYFSMEVASQHPHTTLVAIDLFPRSVTHARANIAAADLTGRISVLAMDASTLGFSDEGVDTVVNYLGLEDIHMTRGYRGVQQTFQEAHRVLTPGGRFYFVALPPDEMETKPQRLEVEVFSWLCGATWLTTAEYLQLVDDAGLAFTAKTSFYTGKKLSVEHAQEEIHYACTYAPLHYGVQTLRFQDAWTRYGPAIQQYGLGHYSKTVLFETTKPLP